MKFRSMQLMTEASQHIRPCSGHGRCACPLWTPRRTRPLTSLGRAVHFASSGRVALRVGVAGLCLPAAVTPLL